MERLQSKRGYDGERDPIYCLDQMTPETKAEIFRALKQSGNFQAGDGIGWIGILSASNRIAAVIQTR